MMEHPLAMGCNPNHKHDRTDSESPESPGYRTCWSQILRK